MKANTAIHIIAAAFGMGLCSGCGGGGGGNSASNSNPATPSYAQPSVLISPAPATFPSSTVAFQYASYGNYYTSGGLQVFTTPTGQTSNPNGDIVGTIVPPGNANSSIMGYNYTFGISQGGVDANLNLDISGAQGFWYDSPAQGNFYTFQSWYRMFGPLTKTTNGVHVILSGTVTLEESTSATAYSTQTVTIEMESN